MTNIEIKYSDLIADWLSEAGYTHCFYVAGGNVMHLLASCNRLFQMQSFVHEVGACIAAEYFNEASSNGQKAFVLVTAGPGLTNLVTGIAGAFLESRDLLVLGGQVKTADLSHGTLRQRGIQEVDGVSVVQSLCKVAQRLDKPLPRAQFIQLTFESQKKRKGPVFLEIPLDVQGKTVQRSDLEDDITRVIRFDHAIPDADKSQIAAIADLVKEANRPIFLIGGGVSRQNSNLIDKELQKFNIPVCTTWNGADRVAADHPCYAGRPNTWGQRYANILLQQADVLIAVGTRLGLQQTGFNWQEFVPLGKIVQVDCDGDELSKGHPKLFMPVQADADDFLRKLLHENLGDHRDWLSFCKNVRERLPSVEKNHTGEGFLSPYAIVSNLSRVSAPEDIVIPCSSGGAFTVSMQSFEQKTGQIIITSKGLASMGYGLSGAIGAAFADTNRRVLLIEGDGGFAQNLQELGTVKVNRSNIKIFLFDDGGYASIRMTQRNYFGGDYIGCDSQSGLGLPNWEKLFDAFDVPAMRLEEEQLSNPKFLELFNYDGPAAFVVPIDPQQTYFPKIASQISVDGSMISNPLHLMSPELSDDMNRSLMPSLFDNLSDPETPNT